MNRFISVVELPGPPPVSTLGKVNSCNAPMASKTMARTSVWPSSGSVMCQKRCHSWAPSTRAASCKSVGMFGRGHVSAPYSPGDGVGSGLDVQIVAILVAEVDRPLIEFSKHRGSQHISLDAGRGIEV